ncbi:hypothetical protein GIB67_019883 [Kingdonia uniflora]|uniref:DNA-(apurinic or apyrimidinic site) endonuclease n=1 Tax=Kingdonia uniflora TaxID=39325 RepID=A0A7J7MKH6_9MAGN|nr:hypothetical protein GIB67_019883 [Kingdonia uniflora]
MLHVNRFAFVVSPRVRPLGRLMSMMSSLSPSSTSTSNVKKPSADELRQMSLPQLRTMSKSFGIPARGSKQSLVLALKCLLEKEEEGSLVVKENVASSVLSTKSETDTSTYISYKRRGRLDVCGGKGVDNGSKSVVAEEKMLLEVNEVSGKANISGGKHTEDAKPISEVPGSQRKRRKAKSSVIDDSKPSPKMKLASETGSKDSGPVDRAGSSEILSEPWAVLAHKKPQKEWIPYNPKTMRTHLANDTKFVKLLSWNVNGLRALLKQDFFSEMAQREKFDVLCLQETKLQASWIYFLNSTLVVKYLKEKDVEKIKESLVDGYENSFWACSVSKLGYSGTAIISRIKPLSVRYGLGILDHDSEGRIVTVEFDTFFLISGYVPNSGDGLRRLTYRITQWDPSLAGYMKELEKSKPVILTGDLNCAHQEIDIFNPAGNRRNAGFTDEERNSFETNFLSNGFVDTFRRQHPGVVGYTYWGYRHNGRASNKGWRLDYFLVSESIAEKVHDSYILPDVGGSDHCPIGVILKL